MLGAGYAHVPDTLDFWLDTLDFEPDRLRYMAGYAQVMAEYAQGLAGYALVDGRIRSRRSRIRSSACKNRCGRIRSVIVFFVF